MDIAFPSVWLPLSASDLKVQCHRADYYSRVDELLSTELKQILNTMSLVTLAMVLRKHSATTLSVADTGGHGFPYAVSATTH